MDLTILELHLDNARFNAPFAAGEETPTGDDESVDTSGGGFDPRVLVVIAVLGGLAVLAKYLRSGEGVDVEVDDGVEIEQS